MKINKKFDKKLFYGGIFVILPAFNFKIDKYGN